MFETGTEHKKSIFSKNWHVRHLKFKQVFKPLSYFSVFHIFEASVCYNIFLPVHWQKGMSSCSHGIHIDCMLQKLKARQGLWLHNLFGLIWQTEIELNPSHAKEQNETTTIVRHLSKYLTIGAHLIGQELVHICMYSICQG